RVTLPGRPSDAVARDESVNGKPRKREAPMRSIVVFVAVSLLATSLAEAQEDSAKVGVGLAFLASNPVGQLTGTSTLYLPVQTGRSFRVEPTLGWHHASVEETSSDPTSPVNGISESSSALLLGIGLFGTARPGSGTLLYYGPRLGVAWSRVRDTDQAGNSLKESQTDWFAIAALGGQHGARARRRPADQRPAARLLRPRWRASRPDPEARRVGDDRRQARRAGVGPSRPAHRVLGVRTG